jgi:hypothetical protein
MSDQLRNSEEFSAAIRAKIIIRPLRIRECKSPLTVLLPCPREIIHTRHRSWMDRTTFGFRDESTRLMGDCSRITPFYEKVIKVKADVAAVLVWT